MCRRGKVLFSWGLAIITVAAAPLVAYSQYDDPLDPFNFLRENEGDPPGQEDDSNKSAQELYAEGIGLLQADQPLDGRTKLLRALAKDPSFYPAHSQLAFYYITQVGHYRLALKYVKWAQELFEQQKGLPPYNDRAEQMDHAQIIYLLSQARLNLDDYSGALAALDEYEKYGYFAPWYPGTRSWILMKLGRLDEAIEVARLGVITRSDPGRTLNMLGILLSMSGEPTKSLQVFREAIQYEVSLGEMGQPATPLNNSGEVYKESFEDSRAAESWQRAKSLHDGCEHVLPSLNLALLRVDHLDLQGAQSSMNSFLACFAKFTLRNDEEHRALVHLMRGRVALLSGFPTLAIPQLQRALDNIQWFGKIGTSEGDLRAGTTVSLARAFDVYINDLATRKSTSWAVWFATRRELITARIRSWWLKRRARQILAEELKNFEDLRIRHTDSLLEYPTLGEALTGFPTSTLKRRIEIEKKSDARSAALPFYTLYLAENHLARGSDDSALALINETLANIRRQGDELLWLHATALKAKLLPESSTDRDQLILDLFAKHPPACRIYRLSLPVTVQASDASLAKAIQGTLLRPVAAGASPYVLGRETLSAQEGPKGGGKDGAEEDTIELTLMGPDGMKRGTGKSIEEAINALLDAVFTLGVGEEVKRV